MTDRKDRIAEAFTAQADVYDAAADLQWQVAARLAHRIQAQTLRAPSRILEIGCGTGFLSSRLQDAFPDATLYLTDIAPTMLDRCRARVGAKPHYRVMDGEKPEGLTGRFDLIASSLAFQWFVDLPGAVQRLAELLAPQGRMMFSTLGQHTFHEWRAAHTKLGLVCGTPDYPAIANFPWPIANFTHDAAEETIIHPYANGRDFVNTLKLLGASEPAPGHQPLSTTAFRKLLQSLSGTFDVSYHVIYGEIRA